MCNAGEYLNETGGLCMLCPLGKYNPLAGNVSFAIFECLSCALDFTTSKTGSVSGNQCNVSE